MIFCHGGSPSQIDVNRVHRVARGGWLVSSSASAIFGQRESFIGTIITTLTVEHVDGRMLHEFENYLDSDHAEQRYAMRSYLASEGSGFGILRLFLRSVAMASAFHEEYLFGDVHPGNLMYRIVTSQQPAIDFVPCFVDCGAVVRFRDLEYLKQAAVAMGYRADLLGFGPGGARGSHRCPGPHQGLELQALHGNLEQFVSEIASEVRLQALGWRNAEAVAASRYTYDASSLPVLYHPQDRLSSSSQSALYLQPPPLTFPPLPPNPL